MTTQETSTPSVVLTEATVHSAIRLTPAFVRVELASPSFAELGEEGFDTRFKVLLPGPTGELPAIPEVAEDCYESWMSTPDDVRSPMRTYTIRDVVRDGDDVRLVVDFVVHETTTGGTAGPACRWALSAAPGDVIKVIAPHRSTEYGGTEFDPAGRSHLLLIGDETAVPALSRILEDLGPGHTARSSWRCPPARTSSTCRCRPGFELKWFPRNDDSCGRRLVQEVRRHLGLPPSKDFDILAELTTASDLDIDVWETPRYSSAGEDVEAQLQSRSLGHDLDDTYAWIAGESWLVKALRRSLVNELDVDRSQVAFMGYWREGVAMKG